MRFIKNNKIYDTDKAELILTFYKQWEMKEYESDIMYSPWREASLYKTAKGAYFLTCTDSYGYSHIDIIDENTAKEYLMKHNYEKYAEMFGELEEA